MNARSSRMFQITEDDMAELERTLPELTERLWTPDIDNRTRVQLRRVQTIMSNVRWSYGPPMEVKIISADGLEPDDGPKKDREP